MPNQETFEGELAPVAWEAICHGWNASRNQDGNLLIELDDGECCRCSLVHHDDPAPSNQALGLGLTEKSFAVVASVPVIGTVELTGDLLTEVDLWAAGRNVPVGTPLLTPCDVRDGEAQTVRITIDYQLAGFGYRPEEVAGVIADIAAATGPLRETIIERFGGLREEAQLEELERAYDTPLTTVKLTTVIDRFAAEFVAAPVNRIQQMDLFGGATSHWRSDLSNQVLPEALRELLMGAGQDATRLGIEGPTPIMLARECARRDPRAFEQQFGPGSMGRLWNLSRQEIAFGSKWNVQHLLKRTALRHDPTKLMIPHVLIELEAMMPELFERTVKPFGSDDLVPTDDSRSNHSGEQDPAAGEKPKAHKVPRRSEIERLLRKRVKGQDEVAAKVASRLAMSFRGLMAAGSPHPKGVFLFAGPTGVGKTEMAKAIADTVYGPGDNMVRLDMSEYREGHSVSRLIGPPPGYVGHTDPGGWLTTKMIANPRRVLLLDEFEKADQAVWQSFLQVFDEGRLTDGRGQTADFSEAVIVLTTNLGSRGAATRVTGFGQAVGEEERGAAISRHVMGAVRRALPPELLNRVDGAFAFSPLGEELIVEIVRERLKVVKGELAEAGYEVDFTPAVARAIGAYQPDPYLGARPAIRAIDRLVREPFVDLKPGRYRMRTCGGVVCVDG